MLDVLAELNEKKKEPLVAAAHDLRSPLSAKSLTAENILSRDPEAAVKNLKKVVARILRTTTRMTDLVNNILDVAAIDSGRISLKLGETDLNELLTSRVAVAKYVAERKEIALEFQCDIAEARLQLDSERFSAAVDNLVSNALKYTHPGGQVVVRLGHRENDFEIAVEDDGQGFPKEDVDQLFRKFGRLSAEPTGNETSTGFGLAIVRKSSICTVGKSGRRAKSERGRLSRSQFRRFLTRGLRAPNPFSSWR
ncbi:MAG: signal transduction histidine kinase [Planctomycetota bacterium]|jgi:signal transduction histidine kinase